jgi:hypothetical protein
MTSLLGAVSGAGNTWTILLQTAAGGAPLGVDAEEAGFAIQAVDDERGFVEPK